MRKTIEIFLVAAGGLAAASCTIKDDCEERVCVMLQPAVGAALKADTEERENGEQSVEQLCYMAFNDSGKRVFFQTYETMDSHSVSLKTGTYTFVATANIPPPEVEAASARGKTEFLAWCPPGLYDKMIGGSSVSIAMSHITSSRYIYDEMVLALPLKRLASRIILKSVKNSMGIDLKVKGVFLGNLVPSVKMDGGSAALQTQTSEWRSFKGSAGAGGEVQGLAHAINSPLAAGQTITPEAKPLYAFPNNTQTDVNAGSGNERRKTRLILSVESESRTYYYPVNLNMKPGFSYDVKLVLTHLGSLNPDSFEWYDPYSDGSIIVDDGEDNGGEIIITF